MINPSIQSTSCYMSSARTVAASLVDSGSAVTLWPQTQPLQGARRVDITLTSTSGNNIPTLGSTTRELNLGGQLFWHNFICAKVKQPILGQDFLAENRLVENYAEDF